MRVLAIDQGTTSTRGLLFDGDAPPRLLASRRHQQSYPRPGWVEQPPLEILDNIIACIEAAGPVDAIGLANQGESCLAWDAVTGEPLSPIISWQDNRTADAIEAIRLSGQEAFVRAATGLPLDAYFSASKLGWIVREIPAASSALRAGRLRLGTSDAFFLDRLTGVFATDTTTASRTSLMDMERSCWSDALCTLFGVPIEALPPIRFSTAGYGEFRGIPIAASLVDQQAALYGHGARNPGDSKITFGTGAFALALAGPTPPRPGADGLIGTVAWSDKDTTCYALEGGVYDAGAAIEWTRRIGLTSDPAMLDALPAAPAIEQGLMFVPALSGLACPYWRRDVGAAWTGMTTATSRSDLLRAVLEGIALQTAIVIEALERQVGQGGPVSIDGGVAQNDVFVQFLSDVSGREIRRAGSAEMTSFGCAMLAGHPVERPADSRRFTPQISAAQRQSWRSRYVDAVSRLLP